MTPWIKIQSYKHDGSLHRCWERNFLLEDNEEYFITASKRTRVIEYDGRRWYSKEPAVAFFSKKYWFNVIAMLKDDGVIFYVNLASPTLMAEEMLRYIDYDLDFKLFPDGRVITLDEGEHARYTKRYQYSPELQLVIQKAKTRVLSMLKNHTYPFDTQLVDDYYAKFLALTRG